ncbi:iron complex transport system substrate-binding protein [Roseivivax halotolerans]|uniref:Iron complex transport system substrate-binding protein n=1 Tax=Roseivivax halotolerans TaxID=93684 RepID=A0A1I6A673_9RHOB|nr:ABC transporter substrate-binding protein [Roseivivax halotolerans]SFQ64231.1 iron complex transport system substrate-binding protein [Roseivivax halotolerans]
MKNQLTMVFILTSFLLTSSALAQDCSKGLRLFEHHAGTGCIPADPQRIVTLTDINALLPLMTELGVTPVASAGHIDDSGDQIFRRMGAYDTSSIEWVGTYGSPDPEAVAAQNPDLIIGSPYPETNYEIFSKIAPTVILDMFEYPADDTLLMLADAVNRTERAREQQTELEAVAEGVRETLGADFERTTLSIIATQDTDRTFYRMEPQGGWGVIREYLDPTMTPPERPLDPENPYERITYEALPEHAADVMFLVTWDHDETGHSAIFEDFLADPLVQALPVAQASKIFNIEGQKAGGFSWTGIGHGLERIAEVVTRDDLNRDLVVE